MKPNERLPCPKKTGRLWRRVALDSEGSLPDISMAVGKSLALLEEVLLQLKQNCSQFSVLSNRPAKACSRATQV